MVKGEVSFESKTVGGDFVIQKRDGMPTYNFAVVVDDHLMQISHVFRGDDHVANTPKQLMIYEAFGWNPPKFGHMSLIINTETGKKLSKRDETVLQFIEQYRELGYLPEAMLNFIILLGWSPVGESELFTKREFIKMYDEKRLSKSPASFDGKKLEWVNNQYIKKTNENEVFSMSIQQLIKAGRLPKRPTQAQIEWTRTLVSLFKNQMSYTGQIVDLADLFFNGPAEINDEAKAELAVETAPTVLKEFRKRVEDIDVFEATEIQKTIKSIQKDTKIKGRQLYMPIRIAVSHEMHGPELPETIELLGRETTIKHLDAMIAELAK